MPSDLHTFVVSDMHLTEAHDPEPDRPLWMAHKRREFFVDDAFTALLQHIEEAADGPVELVLNGDIFDFDSVTAVPDTDAAIVGPDGGRREVNWLARIRGLASEEWMSQFKMQVIIDDHPVWFTALREFVARGHRAIFVIGNHDAELHWPSVQQQVRDAIDLPDEEAQARIVFCEWFYLSGEDTFISHGHQYDPNCTLRDCIHPLIEVHGRPRVRIPFGDLAAKYMLNGMGYFNPHATENYIMSATDYLRFFLKYMLRTQPLLIWTWFWGAITTLYISLRDHWHHPMRDPLHVDDKVKDIAQRSQSTPSMVRKLNALHVPSASNNPFRIARELWLDRAFLLFGALFVASQVVLIINFGWPISPLWVFVPLAILLFPYVMYATKVRAAVFDVPLLTEKRAELIFKITGVRRVVFGHTHKPKVEQVGPVTLYNAGFWSAAFAEPDCIHRIGEQTFVWIRPSDDPAEEVARQAELCRWPLEAQASAA